MPKAVTAKDAKDAKEGEPLMKRSFSLSDAFLLSFATFATIAVKD